MRFVLIKKSGRNLPLLLYVVKRNYRETAILSILFQKNHGFNVMGLWKHIDWLDGFQGESNRGEVCQITHQAFRIAGNIDAAFAADSGEGICQARDA